MIRSTKSTMRVLVSALTAVQFTVLMSYATDTMRFCDPAEGGIAEGQIVSGQARFCLQSDTISPGMAYRLRISRNGGPSTAKKLLNGNSCPEGCSPGVWQPCADFTVPAASLFPDGAYTATAEVYQQSTDLVIFSTSLQFILDKTKPVSSQALSPSKSVYNETDTNISYTGTATDVSGFRSYNLVGNVFEESGGPSSSPLVINKTIDMSLLPDGTYMIDLLVQDGAGFMPGSLCRSGPNTATSSIQFSVTKSPPRLTGHVSLEAWPVSPAELSATIEFRLPGSAQVLRSYPMMLDDSGNYSVGPVSAGTYDVAVKFSHWLRSLSPSRVIVAGQNTVNFVCQNGDAEPNNVINIYDMNRVLTKYGHGSDPLADLNGNGSVDIFDLSIVLTHFGLSGPP